MKFLLGIASGCIAIASLTAIGNGQFDDAILGGLAIGLLTIASLWVD